MGKTVATLFIQRYQLDDFLNIMLTSNYVVEIKNKSDKEVFVTVRTKREEER